MSLKAELTRLILALSRKIDALDETLLPEPQPYTEPEPELENFRHSQPGLSMNSIARDIPRARPPRRPGQQQRRHNGAWWHY